MKKLSAISIYDIHAFKSFTADRDKKPLKIADGADILPAPSAYKINTNAIGDYEMPLAILYLFKSIIIECI